MKHYSVSSLTGTAIGSITFRGDKPVFTAAKAAYGIAPKTLCQVLSLGRAALYLESEPAAVSCTCDGYVVAKA